MRLRSLLTLALAAGVAAPLAAQDTRPGVAVLPFDNGGSYGQDAEDFRALEIGLQQMLITELGVNPNIRSVDRSRIKASLAERDLATSGRVDAQIAARLGKMVGARYVVAGSFVDFYGDFRLDARIIDVETSEIIKTEKVRDKRENLYDLVVSLASQITRGVNLTPLPRQAMEQRQRRNVPAEAVRLYTKALLYEDRGQTARAVELFNQAKQVYPQYTEVDEALKRIGRG
jgi:TolB-like protein